MRCSRVGTQAEFVVSGPSVLVQCLVRFPQADQLLLCSLLADSHFLGTNQYSLDIIWYNICIFDILKSKL